MEYTLKLTQQEIQILSTALGELPLKMSLNLFGKIQTQVQTQDAENAVSIVGASN